MTPGRLGAAAMLALLVAVGCKGPVVPNPMTGESRYLCCNLHYDKTTITDVNWQVGALVPLGTRVQVQEVRRNSVTFQPEGHPPLTLVLRYGRKNLSMDTYLDRLFVVDDPRGKLPQARGRDQRTRARAERLRKSIEAGVIEEGMTRDQVLMALGYPPAHRTPSLDAPTWTYWDNRWASFVVAFDGDTVSRVAR